MAYKGKRTEERESSDCARNAINTLIRSVDLWVYDSVDVSPTLKTLIDLVLVFLRVFFSCFVFRFFFRHVKLASKKVSWQLYFLFFQVLTTLDINQPVRIMAETALGGLSVMTTGLGDEADLSVFENKSGLAEDLKFLASMPELCDVRLTYAYFIFKVVISAYISVV